MGLKFQNEKLLNKFWLLNLSIWKRLNEKCSRGIVLLRTKIRWSVGTKISGQGCEQSGCDRHDSRSKRKYVGLYHAAPEAACLCEIVFLFILLSNFANSFTFTIRKMPWLIFT